MGSPAVLPGAGRRRDAPLVAARPEKNPLQTPLRMAPPPAALHAGYGTDRLWARQGDSQPDAGPALLHAAAAGRPAHADAFAVDLDGRIPGVPDLHRPGRIAGRPAAARAAD